MADIVDDDTPLLFGEDASLSSESASNQEFSRPLRRVPGPYSVKIFARAGNGGDGCMSFDRGPSRPKGVPDGGHGGDGGDIWAVCSSSHDSFLDCQRAPHVRSSSGKNGTSKKKKGANGDKRELFVPLGTSIYDDKSGFCLGTLMKHGDRMLLVRGGRGGQGNVAFKSSVERRPRQTKKGEKGQEQAFYMKMLLVADVGLLGLPNAGKSSLLSVMSRASPKIAAYPFTTLTPSLGVIEHEHFPWETFTVTDLPGLVDQAHIGVGLGHDFLEHLHHCRILLHVVDITEENCFENYALLRRSLSLYSQSLAKKEELIVFSKIDCIEDSVCKSLQDAFEKKYQKTPLLCSAKDLSGLDAMKRALWSLLPSRPSIPRNLVAFDPVA